MKGGKTKYSRQNCGKYSLNLGILGSHSSDYEAFYLLGQKSVEAIYTASCPRSYNFPVPV
jgi:hypothetical protein